MDIMQVTPQVETEKEINRNAVKQGRKFFSKMGFLLLLGTILVFGIQIGVAYLVNALRPEWLNNMDTYMIVTMVPMYLLGMPLLILLLKAVPAQRPERHKMSVGAILLAIIMSYSLMYISNLVGTTITSMLEKIRGEAIINDIEIVATSLNPILSMFFMVICAPIMEELIFRKVLVDRAVKYGEGVAIVLSGVVFGLFHANLSQLVYASALGMFFAFIYVKTGRLRYTVIIHMTVNFMGGVIAPFLLKILNTEETLALLESENVDAVMHGLKQILPGLILLLCYAVLVIGMVIAGVVLFIVFRKKFRLTPKGISLPKGKRLTTVYLNAGMISFVATIVAWIVWNL